jgi:hypothetical protein
MSRQCTIDGCDRPLVRRDWCWAHYERWRNHGDPTVILVEKQIGECRGRLCRRPKFSRGWCRAHYMRVHRNGHPGDRVIGNYRAWAKVRRWPAVALLPEVDGSYSELARLLGRARMSESKWERALLTTDQADAAALLLGLHPAEVWDSWLSEAA